jgi:hypothetical protein
MANEFVAKNGLISQKNTTVTGSLIVTNGITGSLRGTASWASNAVFANGATSANQIYIAENTSPGTYSIPVYPDGGFDGNNTLLNANISYEYATQALTVNSITASNGLFGTSSWATNALTASYIPGLSQKTSNFIQSADGAAVTLTTNNTLSSTLLIPSNSVVVGDSISIKVRASKTGTTSVSRIFVYINTSATLSGATLLASGPTAAGLQIFQQLARELIVKSSTVTESFPTATQLITDDNTTSVTISNTNIDWTTDQYFIFSLQLGNANDSIKTTYSRVTVLKN